jgi:hypothetical protein
MVSRHSREPFESEMAQQRGAYSTFYALCSQIDESGVPARTNPHAPSALNPHRHTFPLPRHPFRANLVYGALARTGPRMSGHVFEESRRRFGTIPTQFRLN